MSIHQRKRIWFRVLSSRITLVIALVICVFFASSVYERYTIEREMAARRANAESELIKLEERKVELEKKVEYLNAEYGVEAEMRKHFDVAKEGEQVVIIVDEDREESKDAEESTSEETDENESWWTRLFGRN